jgi:hypothetical protein
MSDVSVERLISVDTWLSRSFAACLVLLAATFIWSLGRHDPDSNWIAVTLLLLQLGASLWFAFAAGAAATALGSSGWVWVVWILAAPFLARIPIPFLPILIAASPLSIRFLLGSQLQIAIRQAGTATLHP